VQRENRSVTSRGADVPVRIYRSANPSGRAMVYIHGGGFVMGGLDACDHICADLAALTGDVIVSVDYRLAPEDPFPAGLDDCEDVLRWVSAQAGTLSIDPTCITVAGDSAGGNLSIALALRLRDEGGPTISRLVSIYPMLDLTCSRDSWVSEAAPYMNRERALSAVAYYHGEASAKDPLVSPLFADDLRGLPPTLVLTAEHDTLRCDGEEFVQMLADAGVAVRHTQFRRMPHGFLSLPRLASAYDQALWEITAHVRQG